MKLNFQDIRYQLHVNVNVEFELSPVRGHNMNGRVKRKIREIEGSITKSLENERISQLEWETLVSEKANTINDLPLALGNITSQFENMDLPTPNQLRLGRNNDRSPIGPMMITSNPEKFLFINEKLFNTWFEYWLIYNVPKLMHHPKWFQTYRDVKVREVVLFSKQENHLSSTYQYGIISEAVMIRFIKQLFVIEIVPKYLIDLLIVQWGNWSWSILWTNSTWWKSWDKLRHLLTCNTNWAHDLRTFLVRAGVV